MKKYQIILTILFLFCLVGVQTAAVSETAVAQTAIDQRFGAVESFWAPNEAAELGVGWERILFYWNEIQPAGPEDWNTLHVLEEWLVEANAQGRTVTGLLKNTPLWATDDGSAAGVPRGLYLPIDDPNNLWANYTRRVASYYSQRGVHNWIIWNEPDIAPDVYGHEFAGSMDDYVQLLKVAYLTIKQVDPNAKIHLGGLTHWHDPSYLGRLMQRIAAEPDAAANNYYFDIVSQHIYFRPETVSSIVGNGFYAQQQAGISPFKAVWINETNARPSMDPEWPVEVQAFQVDLEQQAWYIPQAYALGFYAGAGRISMYKLVDVNLPPGGESWGLIRPDDFSKRPAFYAYQTTIKHLAGFEYPIGREQSGNHYLFSFNTPRGVTKIMWARNQAAVTLRVPALAESAQLVQATGEETTITPTNGVYEIRLDGARCYAECLMGGPPVFLVEAGVRSDGSGSAPPVVQPVDTATPEAAEETAVPTEAATETAEPTTDATDTPEPTETATIAPTDTAEPTATNTPEPTVTETVEPTETATAVAALPTETSEPTAVATEVAAVVETAVPPTPIPEQEPAQAEPAQGQAGLWVLGTAVLLFGLLLWSFLRRRRAA